MNKRFAVLFFSLLTLAFPLGSGPREDLQARLRSVLTQIHDLQTELSGSRRDLREYDLSNSIFLLELDISERLMKRPDSFQEKLDMRLKKQYLPECEKIFVHASNWPDRPPIIYLCEKSYPSSVLSHLIADLQGTIIHVRNATISN